ncbi:MAG TPA: DHHW family protein [Chitinophagaceae bacterium]
MAAREQIGQKIQIANVIIFCVLLFVGGIASLAMRKTAVSEMENRKLAAFPQYSDSTLLSGEYFKQIELYYADNFPMRDRWINVSNKFRDRLGFEYGDIKIYEPVNETDASNPSDTAKQTLASILPDNGETGEVKKKLFVFKNRAFEMFGCGPQMGKAYADVINSYNRAGIPNLQVYNLVIPVALEFELTEKYRSLQKPNRPAIENVYSHLDSNIKRVWAIDEMRKHREEYIYFNTDHHWTSLGAYYAYRSFCETAGLPPVSLDTVAFKVKPAFLGSLYRLTRDEKLKSNPDSVIYYLFKDSLNFYIGNNTKPGAWSRSKMYGEGAKGSNSYSVFLQGDLPVVKMETQHKNGRKILMVKESYGNAFAPFLVNNYEKVIVVDQRYFTANLVDLIKQEGINELLFINNIFAAHTAFHIDKIKGLKK